MTNTDLSSAKYMQPVLQNEKKALRKARNAKAIQDFTTFLMGLGAMYVGVAAVQHRHLWLPYVQSILGTVGW